MPIGVALIGAGLFMQDAHLPGIQASPDLELKAVYSRSLKSAAGIATDLQLGRYADDTNQGLPHLLERADIQAVIIALPITKQAHYVRAALSAGKHVLSEKPIAKDIAEAVSLIQWYRSEIAPKGITWAVAENWRYLDTVRYGRKHLGQLRKIRQFRTQVYVDCRPGHFEYWNYVEVPWRQKPDHQGGLILDLGVHHLAATRYLLGSERITRVNALVAALDGALPPADTVDAIFQTESGAQGTFTFSTCSSLQKDTGYAVVGENGNLRVQNEVVTVQINGKDDVKKLPVERLAVVNEVKAWAEALAKGTVPPEQRPEEALADLELVELILKSGHENGAPQFPQHQRINA
ncbi:Gfo/Idh/MocA family protein [Aspergillus ibericus CBS 121593]|uniref:Oxidoreductase family, NAD-binding Rossmann fold protein n=1 Tax=Aspergillus ibericus CBS 121593 TaxID=1448316 RepID=A0A395H4P9_9EURO|nr:oxidoreductase family, NAD-binding Rossmann fold protein [Aspergillus ibericus CBS 121593]RAL02175.1 oxidoreductase family, NAD-binding Rossmann fold protein [Aspergillus ibericus CBS 121593]